ncbi:unnamed protein product [Rotaria magnacalcarata]|uniref:Uncharacterized protein n=1 Tax=Rotaria magnacalcarata TaxID=392030 RepID=A0A819F4P4_9BILA|nr:unnamed protein product [Rotaria magnacalcarata]
MSARKTRNIPSSQSIAAEYVQCATTREYNEAALNPSLVVSSYINAWLEEHSRVYMYDPFGILQYILSLASFLGDDNYVFRNNRKKTPTTLYLSLCTRPAYGKSYLFQATKDSIIKLLCIRQGLGVYARSNNRKAKINIQMPDLNAFADELTRLGLLTALEKAPRLLLFDELDQLFIRNGLIPLPNSTQNENNFYEITLQLYSDNCLFSKHTSTSETTFQSKRLCIMGNHTQEPCNRLVLRKLNGEGPNPFFERHLMLCARTPVTEKKFNPDIFNHKQFAPFDQLSLTISYLVVLDFYFDDEGRALAIGFGFLI